MNFGFYISEGIWHILDVNALDHFLFVITLCCVYSLKDFKKILMLLTAFTLGHCTTLIFSGLGILSLNQDFIEMLIPITILSSGFANILFYKSNKKASKIKYTITVLFGLIHGAGFSNYFKNMLEGIEDSLFVPLLEFNLGIEVGQIFIFIFYLLISWVLNLLFKLKLRTSANIASVCAILFALKMLFYN